MELVGEELQVGVLEKLLFKEGLALNLQPHPGGFELLPAHQAHHR